MKVIGLTGGIGAGKSTVSRYLKEKGYYIIDADEISHRITEKGSPVLSEIAAVFGSDMIDEEGDLQRKKLAAAVFSDPEKRSKLEKITTKRVVDAIETELKRLRAEDRMPVVFVDAPLLFEAGVDRLTDSVILIDADEEIKIDRVMKRDGVSRRQVLDRMANQMSSAEKAARADILLDNSTNTENLYHQVEEILKTYEELK